MSDISNEKRKMSKGEELAWQFIHQAGENYVPKVSYEKEITNPIDLFVAGFSACSEKMNMLIFESMKAQARRIKDLERDNERLADKLDEMQRELRKRILLGEQHQTTPKIVR